MRSARMARTRFRLAKCRSAAMSSRCGSGSSGRAVKNNIKLAGGHLAKWYGERLVNLRSAKTLGFDVPASLLAIRRRGDRIRTRLQVLAHIGHPGVRI